MLEEREQGILKRENIMPQTHREPTDGKSTLIIVVALCLCAPVNYILVSHVKILASITCRLPPRGRPRHDDTRRLGIAEPKQHMQRHALVVLHQRLEQLAEDGAVPGPGTAEGTLAEANAEIDVAEVLKRAAGDECREREEVAVVERGQAIDDEGLGVEDRQALFVNGLVE